MSGSLLYLQKTGERVLVHINEFTVTVTELVIVRSTKAEFKQLSLLTDSQFQNLELICVKINASISMIIAVGAFLSCSIATHQT